MNGLNSPSIAHAEMASKAMKTKRKASFIV